MQAAKAQSDQHAHLPSQSTCFLCVLISVQRKTLMALSGKVPTVVYIFSGQKTKRQVFFVKWLPIGMALFFYSKSIWNLKVGMKQCRQEWEDRSCMRIFLQWTEHHWTRYLRLTGIVQLIVNLFIFPLWFTTVTSIKIYVGGMQK